MGHRALGKTGLTVSRLGLGLAALGRPGYISLGHAADLHASYDVSAMQVGAHAVLDAAWQAGVRYFDAARSYGRAEDFLASWLHSRRIAPGAVTVGSKWGYTYRRSISRFSPAMRWRPWSIPTTTTSGTPSHDPPLPLCRPPRHQGPRCRPPHRHAAQVRH